ncbi:MULTISPECIES: STAS domain-containing protein [Nostocales]|uniref:Anti-sigma factor antagonist n=3 Tax=Nostocales TaxID=1161 RepID=A0A0C1RFQ4_9CYAN|nr:STAS domain-containing protein [Tolypothrix bouteillei]KAF3887002.1 STAS domain-containing protein [Tolypothrix bouteillei VB521301]
MANPVVKVIRPNGILDSTQGQEFRQVINEVLEQDNNTRIVLLDFQNVTFMDSSGLGALVLAFKALRAADKKLIICAINEQVRILFELTGMDKVFEIFPNEEEFNKAVMSRS